MSFTAPAYSVPHFGFPFQFESGSGAVVNEQDSYEDVLSCVAAVAFCQVGSCPVLPTFGISDPTFDNPPTGAGLIASVKHWEPRADPTIVAQAVDLIDGAWQLTLSAAVTGTGH